MVRRAELEVGRRPSCRVVDAELECRPEQRSRLIEGERGLRRTRCPDVVLDGTLDLADRGSRSEMVSEIREHAIEVALVVGLDRLANATVQLSPPCPGEPVEERPAHELVGEAIEKPEG